jgi:hypothetical protein
MHFFEKNKLFLPECQIEKIWREANKRIGSEKKFEVQ